MTTISINNRPEGFASGKSTPSITARIKRLIAYRRILRLLVVRDLKVRYAGSALGYVWTVLDPLLMSLVYFFVFTKIFHRSAGTSFEPYLLYLVSGQLAWAWFAGGVGGVTRALRAEAQMVRSSNVPRELWVVRVIVSKGLEYFFGLPVLAIFAVAYVTAPTKYIVLLPLAWLMEGVLLLGVGLILAPCTVLFNDLERIVPIVMRVFFYGSPVLYSISNVPAVVRTAFSYNPAVGFLTLVHATFFRAALHEKETYPKRDAHGHIRYKYVTKDGKLVKVARHYTVHYNHWDWVWHSAVTSLVLLAIGVVVFVRLERSVLKEI